MKMNSTTWTILGSIAFIMIIIGGLVWANTSNTRGEELRPFAQCLSEKGAMFYGTFWCPHCRDQKTIFGRAMDAVPYTECSTPDSRGQLQVCADANIERYPTWGFADGERVEGVMSLAQLSEKTGCSLPEPVQ